MQPCDIRIGQIVQLNSGGPNMRVTYTEYPFDRAECDWVNNDGTIERDVFLVQTLSLSKELTFGLAIEVAKKGLKIARKGWNGKGMWVVLMPGLKLPSFNTQAPGAKVNDRTAKFIGTDTPLDSRPYFAMWTPAGQWQPGWLASQADMLADDWYVVE